MIVDKFKKIRIVFNNNKKKMETALKDGKQFVVSYRHYNSLLFLNKRTKTPVSKQQPASSSINNNLQSSSSMPSTSSAYLATTTTQLSSNETPSSSSQPQLLSNEEPHPSQASSIEEPIEEQPLSQTQVTLDEEHIEIDSINSNYPKTWTNEEESDVINFFSQNQFLWKVKDPLYHTKNRSNVLDKIVSRLGNKFTGIMNFINNTYYMNMISNIAMAVWPLKNIVS